LPRAAGFGTRTIGSVLMLFLDTVDILRLRPLFDHLVFDSGGDERDTLLVAGSARSGTTWTADVIAAMTGSRVIFEPCVLDPAYEIATLKKNAHFMRTSLWNYLMYIAADAGAQSPYYEPLHKVLCGDVINSKWCNGDARPGFYRRRLIKEIRANLYLAYVARTWPRVKIIWLVRDAFSVIQSQMRMGSFSWEHQTMLRQERLIDDWLHPYVPAMRGATTLVEQLAHRWCIETMVPYWQGVHELSNVLLMPYENLTVDVASWKSIGEFVGQDFSSNKNFARIASRMSITSRDWFPKRMARVAGSLVRRKREPRRLTADDIDVIRRVAALYGIPYTDRIISVPSPEEAATPSGMIPVHGGSREPALGLVGVTTSPAT
jgi:Sulfotransferase family